LQPIDTQRQFSSTDKGTAFIGFKSENIANGMIADISLANLDDDSRVNRTFTVTTGTNFDATNKIFYYQIPDDEIVHWGNWIGYGKFTDGATSKTWTGTKLKYSISRDITNDPTTKLIVMEDVNAFMDAMNILKADLESYRTTVIQQESDRVTAENNRVTKEGQRVTAESGRVTAESGRTTAESGRVTAESGRVTTFAGYDARITGMESDVNVPATNLVTNGDFSNGSTGWVISGSTGVMDTSTKVIGAQSLKVTPNGAGWCKIYRQISVIVGRKYYFSTFIKNDAFTEDASDLAYINQSGFTNYTNRRVAPLSVSREWTRVSTIIEAYSLNTTITYGLSIYSTVSTKSVWLDGVSVIDLTATFGKGNEPTVEQMDAIMSKFENSWFDGTKNLFRAKEALTKQIAIDSRTEFDAKNLVANGDFSNGTSEWNQYTPTLNSLNSGNLVFANDGAVRTYVSKQLEQPINVGDKIYFALRTKCDVSSGDVLYASTPQASLGSLNIFGYPTIAKTGQFTRASLIATTTQPSLYFGLVSGKGSISSVEIDYIQAINLTATFGAGKEPTLAEMDRLMARYPNSWFDGTKPIQTIETLYQEKANKVQEALITPTLVNGWVGHGAYGYLKYMKDEFGFVHIEGYIENGTAEKVFTLPSGYRPVYSLYLPLIGAFTPSTIYKLTVSSNGDVLIPVGAKVTMHTIFKAV